jgi:hypothetical protein
VEATCLSLNCTWLTLFDACEGPSYACQAAADTLAPADPAQGCATLAALGLACMP